MRTPAMIAIATLIVVSLSPIPSTIAQENDYLIVPGQRVGRWELGKPVDAYGFPNRQGQWVGQADGRPYYDGYIFRVPPGGTAVDLYACRSDNLVFAILMIRRLNVTPQSEAEELKYKTAEGVGIGIEESEVLRRLGRPENTWEWTERHGQFEVLVRDLEYPGLRVLINRSDLKAFAVGPVKEGGWPACQRAVLGGPAVAQQPATTPAFLSRLASTLGVALPSDVRVTPPSPQTPREIAAFSGAWAGKWGGNLAHILVVEEATSDPPRAAVVYAWGTNAHSPRPGWSRPRGMFARGELHLDRFSNGALVIYRLRSNDVLDATYDGEGVISRATMQRVKE